MVFCMMSYVEGCIVFNFEMLVWYRLIVFLFCFFICKFELLNVLSHKLQFLQLSTLNFFKKIHIKRKKGSIISLMLASFQNASIQLNLNAPHHRCRVWPLLCVTHPPSYRCRKMASTMLLFLWSPWQQMEVCRWWGDRWNRPTCLW